MGIIASVAVCPTPRLNLKFELRPSWNNIHYAFPTGTAQGTTLHPRTPRTPNQMVGSEAKIRIGMVHFLTEKVFVTVFLCTLIQ